MQFPDGLEDSPFKHTNKRAGWNKRAGGIFFSKSINMQTRIRPCRGGFFLKINKRTSMSIWYTRGHILNKESGITIFLKRWLIKWEVFFSNHPQAWFVTNKFYFWIIFVWYYTLFYVANLTINNQPCYLMKESIF